MHGAYDQSKFSQELSFAQTGGSVHSEKLAVDKESWKFGL